jgi:hypothetical protein
MEGFFASRRIGMMLIAALMVTLVPIAALPAQAQQFAGPPCPAGTEEAPQAGTEGSICIDPQTIAFGTPPPTCPAGFAPAQAKREVAIFACALLAEEPPVPGGGGGGGNGGGGDTAPLEISQEFEQEAESGDINQSFTATGGGDNGSQCATVTGDLKAGNLQNTTGSLQFAFDIEEIEQEDIDSDLSITGTSTGTCDQQVNQVAAG